MGSGDLPSGGSEREVGVYRDLFDQAPHSYLLVGRDGRVEMANDRAVVLTGVPPDRLVGMPVLSLYAETVAGRQRATELYNELLAGEACTGEVLELQRGDGFTVMVRVDWRPEFDGTGQAVGSRTILVELAQPTAGAGPLARPVTESLQAAALASVGSAVMVTRPDGIIVWVNRAFESMSGYSLDEAVGHTPRLLKSGVQDDTHYAQLWATIVDRRIWKGEIVDRRKDGSPYTVVQTITPILDDDGTITHFVAVHEDVTQLRASQFRMQALFDHALDAIVLFDDDWYVVEANPALAALTGHSVQDLAAMTMADLVPDADRADHAEIWAAFLTEGRARGIMDIRRADEQVRQVEYQAVAGIVEGVNLLVARDVTEQRQAQDHQRFQAQLLEAIGEAVVATDMDGTVRYVNPAAERLYGRSVMPGRPVDTDALALKLDLTAAAAAARDGRRWTGEAGATRSDGTAITLQMTLAPYLDADREVLGTIGVSTDISDLKTTQRLLARGVRQQEVLAELRRHALSGAAARDLATSADALLYDLLGPDIRARFEWGPDADPAGTAPDEGELRFPVGAAGVLRLDGPGAATVDNRDRPFLRSVAHVIHSVVQHDLATAQVDHLSTHDPLTGLINRIHFTQLVEQATLASRADGTTFAVLHLNLDGFKSINDGLGHAIGDEILREVAGRFAGSVRPTDVVAHFGSDEFAVLCRTVTNTGSAQRVARRFQLALGNGFSAAEDLVVVTASIGVALSDSAADGVSLLRHADTAMHQAKAQGRNRVEVFDTGMQVQAREQYDMLSILRSGLDDGRVEVHYQPIIEVGSGRIVGAEALARLRHPDGQMIQPDAFIGVAEQSGLIAAVGEQVLRQACHDVQRWRTVDPALEIAVNLSPQQLILHDAANSILRILEDTGLLASALWLEITESALLAGPEVHADLTRLRQVGIRFAIDDFGTGYSSLAHLRRMPVDMLKIDRSFIDGVLTNPHDRAIVTASIDLARTFGLITTAEGIETAEQFQEIATMGCDLAQGYLWSPPVTRGHIDGMLHPT